MFVCHSRIRTTFDLQHMIEHATLWLFNNSPISIYYICSIMSRMFKMYSGVLFLLLFLFPQVQKGLHDFEHRHDVHCDATSELHLHQLEHVCKLCDFSISVGVENAIINYDLFLNEVSFLFSQGNSQLTFIASWKQLPARAPPVV